MKGYKFVVWINTELGTNTNTPNPIIHARSLKEAWKKFEERHPLKENYWVYDVECLGRVKKVVETRFEYEPIKRPKYESRY